MAVPFEQTLRSLQNDSTMRSRWVGAAGLLTLAVWLWCAFVLSLPTTVASVDGRVVSALPPAQLSSSTDEPVVAVSVRLGDRVKQDDVLIVFDDQQLRLQLQSHREGLSKLINEIESIRVEIASERTELTDEIASFDRGLERIAARIGETEARIEYAIVAERIYAELRSERRIDELKHREAISALEQNRMVLKAQQSEAREMAANKQLAKSRWGSAFAQLKRQESSLAGELAAQRPREQGLERDISELTVTAPFDGVVGALEDITLGQRIPRNRWIMTIVPFREFEFEAAFIAGQAAGLIKAGQLARIEFFALPWTQYGTLTARVIRVGNEERGGHVSVTLAMASSGRLSEHVAHGLKGQATVEVDQATLVQKLLGLIGVRGEQRS